MSKFGRTSSNLSWKLVENVQNWMKLIENVQILEELVPILVGNWLKMSKFG